MMLYASEAADAQFLCPTRNKLGLKAATLTVTLGRDLLCVAYSTHSHGSRPYSLVG